MNKLSVDLTIIGGGPAGLAAGIEAKKAGVKNVIIIERNQYLGGILPQCIHDGFGLEELGKSLTGPEYSELYVNLAKKSGVTLLTQTMVLKITKQREVAAISKKGVYKIASKAIILATGCREKTRWSAQIPGDRSSGIYTAGVAQSLINLYNIMPGKKIMILGSGDVGLIMARRLTLEGAKVLGVVEILPYPSGLPRNVQQCVLDFQIPLFLNHTIVSIHGRERLKRIKIAPVTASGDFSYDNQKDIECDTLLLSLGLIPENELAETLGVKLDKATGGPVINQNFETSIKGLYSVGNCLQVYDTVDQLCNDGKKVGRWVADSLGSGNKGKLREHEHVFIRVLPGPGVRHVTPQRITTPKTISLTFRPTKPLTPAHLCITSRYGDILTKKMRYVTPANLYTIDVQVPKHMLPCIKKIEVRIQ